MMRAAITAQGRTAEGSLRVGAPHNPRASALGVSFR